MSVPEINGQPIPVSDGCKFGSMNVHADSWEAYDALTVADGWTERPLNATTCVKTLGPWPSGYVVVHEPFSPRPSSTIYGITAEQAEEMARTRRVPHALRRDLGGPA